MASKERLLKADRLTMIKADLDDGEVVNKKAAKKKKSKAKAKTVKKEVEYSSSEEEFDYEKPKKKAKTGRR